MSSFDPFIKDKCDFGFSASWVNIRTELTLKEVTAINLEVELSLIDIINFKVAGALEFAGRVEVVSRILLMRSIANAFLGIVHHVVSKIDDIWSWVEMRRSDVPPFPALGVQDSVREKRLPELGSGFVHKALVQLGLVVFFFVERLQLRLLLDPYSLLDWKAFQICALGYFVRLQLLIAYFEIVLEYIHDFEVLLRMLDFPLKQQLRKFPQFLIQLGLTQLCGRLFKRFLGFLLRNFNLGVQDEFLAGATLQVCAQILARLIGCLLEATSFLLLQEESGILLRRKDIQIVLFTLL